MLAFRWPPTWGWGPVPGKHESWQLLNLIIMHNIKDNQFSYVTTTFSHKDTSFTISSVKVYGQDNDCDRSFVLHASYFQSIRSCYPVHSQGLYSWYRLTHIIKQLYILFISDTLTMELWDFLNWLPHLVNPGHQMEFNWVPSPLSSTSTHPCLECFYKLKELAFVH